MTKPGSVLGRVVVLGAHILDVLGRPVVPGATPHLELADIDLAAIADCRALLVGAPDALGAFALDGLGTVVRTAASTGAMVAVDVLRPGSPRDFGLISDVLKLAGWFLPNRDQLCALTGRRDVADAVRDVLALGVGGVAVTMGADGCLVTREDGELKHVPGIEVRVVDTTGCGDGFNAGMITGLLLGCGHVDAARLGVACGSLVATGLGSDAGIGSLGQVLEFLRRAEPAAAARVADRLGAGVA